MTEAERMYAIKEAARKIVQALLEDADIADGCRADAEAVVEEMLESMS